jgi:hypothetical protein
VGTNSKREYLQAIRARYQRVGRAFKSKILDEFCAVCGYHRKHAIRLLCRPLRRQHRHPGPKPVYDGTVVAVLKAIWLATDQLCSKRLKAALPLWLPYYEQACGALLPPLRQKLLAASPATLDRLLRSARLQHRRRGLPGTKPGQRLKHHIPLRTDNDDVHQPGYLEADAVAHCGNSLAGDFVWSLTFTDIFSQWTENRAVWNKGAAEVVARVQEVEAELPFAIRSFDVDHGAEFLNHHLWRYFLDRRAPVGFARSRPYHKDDQAHVEQKNWTHVRQLLGYQRFEDPTLVALVNDLYRDAWDPFHNFFCPSMKLVSNQRVNARWVKKHDEPQTPYERLLASPQVSEQKKRELRERFQQLNPFALKKEIERTLKIIFDRVRCGPTESATPNSLKPG